MTTRTIATKIRKTPQTLIQEFPFTREMALSRFEDGHYPNFLKEYRRRAWEAFEALPMPSTTDEAWRRTDLRSLETHTFRLPEKPSGKYSKVPGKYLQPLTGKRHGARLILLPGGEAQLDMDPDLAAKGVILTDLSTAEREYPQILEKILGKIVRPEEGKFAALAAAMANSGVLVFIPKGVHLERPLQSILWGPGTRLAYFSHILVWLEEDASVTYVHESASPTETGGQTLHAGIVEIHVGPGSSLRFVELQSWGGHVWNFTHERVRVERDGNLDWIFGALGSRLTKNFSDLDLIGEGATGRMSGFYFTNDMQHLDHDTQQNHLAPHTTSDLLFKGALKDKSRSVWQGMIYVAPGAQKTDGYQANRNLILSPQAHADSIPGLEILADDVRCTHGATVGKIDPDQVFYLRSRGVPYAEAERLIVQGFFDPIMQRIPFDGVRNRFQRAILEKML